MRYLYNRIVTEEDDTIIHYDSEYQRTGTNHMGNIDYYTFYREGTEPILVIPTFAREFKDVITMYTKIKDVHTHKAVCIRLKAMFGKKPDAEGFTESGVEKYMYTIKYKDIEVYMELSEGEFTLMPYFRILSKKVIDNRRNINVEDSPEFQGFFQTERKEETAPSDSQD